jgi:hypothetical protein
MLSAASRALGGVPESDVPAPVEPQQGLGGAGLTQQSTNRNPTPPSAPMNVAPHGYADVAMPYAPQVAARTSPGTVPMKTR